MKHFFFLKGESILFLFHILLDIDTVRFFPNFLKILAGLTLSFLAKVKLAENLSIQIM